MRGHSEQFDDKKSVDPVGRSIFEHRTDGTEDLPAADCIQFRHRK